MYGRTEKPKKTEQPAHEPPKDALAALMEGYTPDKKDLKFENERDDGGFDYSDSENSRKHTNSEPSRKQPKSSGRFEEYHGDHTFDKKPDSSQGEYGYKPAEQSTFVNIKQGAVKSGTFVKEKSVASATYLKEKDWKKEKEMAGKAGQATKTGAIFAGRGVARGAGWLWSSGKNEVDKLKNRNPK